MIVTWASPHYRPLFANTQVSKKLQCLGENQLGLVGLIADGGETIDYPASCTRAL